MAVTNEQQQDTDVEQAGSNAHQMDLSPSHRAIQEEDDETGGNGNTKRYHGWQLVWKKIVVATILSSSLFFVIFDSSTNGILIDATSRFLYWVEANPAAGFSALVPLCLLATVLFVPIQLLTLGSGLIFSTAFGFLPGIFLSTAAVFIGSSAGATVAFFIGRFLLRDSTTSFISNYPILVAIDTAVKDKGRRIMILLRLSPIIPSTALNYIAGVSAISVRDYLFALVGLLPGITFHVFLGATARSLSEYKFESSEMVTLLSIAVGILYGILAIGTLFYFAKKELNRQDAEEQDCKSETTDETDEETVCEEKNQVVQAPQPHS